MKNQLIIKLVLNFLIRYLNHDPFYQYEYIFIQKLLLIPLQTAIFSLPFHAFLALTLLFPPQLFRALAENSF
jgi:hypothetical protein